MVPEYDCLGQAQACHLRTNECQGKSPLQNEQAIVRSQSKDILEVEKEQDEVGTKSDSRHAHVN